MLNTERTNNIFDFPDFQTLSSRGIGTKEGTRQVRLFSTRRKRNIPRKTRPRGIGKWVIPRFVFPRDKSGRGVATKSWRESRAHLSRALTAYERWYGDEIRDTDLSSWQFRTVELSSLLAAQHRRTNWPLEKLRVRVAYMINRTFPPFATRPSFQGLKLFPLPWFPWRGIIFQMGRCVCVSVCKVLQKEALSRKFYNAELDRRRS